MTDKFDSMFSAGSIFAGDYKILEKIGQGGVGIVLKAQQLSLSRVVAIKVLRSELTLDQGYRDLIEREAKTVASLDHPHITKIYAAGLENDVYYFVMHYHEGTTLEVLLDKARSGMLLKKKQVYGIADIREIAITLLKALGYAHSKGIIHRDIKPSNIIVDSKKKPYITDFGIACLRRIDKGSGGIMGTPHYMAPEQFSGRADERTDIYSLGLVLYEMLTLKIPYDTKEDILGDVTIRHKVENITVLNPGIPQQFSTVVMRCVERDRNKRYPYCSAVIADLEDPRTLYKPVYVTKTSSVDNSERPRIEHFDQWKTTAPLNFALLFKNILVLGVFVALAVGVYVIKTRRDKALLEYKQADMHYTLFSPQEANMVNIARNFAAAGSAEKGREIIKDLMAKKRQVKQTEFLQKELSLYDS